MDTGRSGADGAAVPPKNALKKHLLVYLHDMKTNLLLILKLNVT